MKVSRLTWNRAGRLATAALIGLLPCALPAQVAVRAPRSDGRQTPLLVYRAASSGSGCQPLAVISHGAGGSEDGYRYLAEALADDGYTAVVMGHRESGLRALTADIRAHGLMGGIRALVADPQAESSRLLDVGAALRWANGQCKAPFRVLLGHSMGAETVMLEAGARNKIDVSSPPAGRDRFDAYVALSPEGPGLVFPDHAWGGIRKPMLILTGTRDQALQGGPEERQIPWHDLPGIPRSRCQWMGVIDGATHINFAGGGWGADRVAPMVTATVARFLEEVRGGECQSPPAIEGMTLQTK